jgi:hypothetical protein
MGLKESISLLAGRLYFEKPARKLSLAEHAAAVRRSGDDLRARLAAARGSEGEAARLRHVIGIERWGLKRLRVLLGEPFVAGGHRPYLPPEGTPWEQLVRDFSAVRAETVKVAERLAAGGPTRSVNHDQFGELSAHGWLRYLDGHARRELGGLK